MVCNVVHSLQYHTDGPLQLQLWND